MNTYQKLCNKIGNDSLATLWESIENKIGYQDTPEYDELITNFYDLLEKIDNDDLRNGIEETSTSCSSAAMYQGFALGFQEAVGLLTGIVKQ